MRSLLMRYANLIVQAAALTMLLILLISWATTLIVPDFEMGSVFSKFFEPWSFSLAYFFSLAVLIVVKRAKGPPN